VSSVSSVLARDRLGVPDVVFFVLCGVAPLTVAAGIVPTAYAVTGLSGVPAAFLVVALILGVFAVGYVAMARHITNPGAFYAFVSRGLGRPVGVGAALVAVLAYNLLQVGLYGALGPGAAAYAAQHAGVHAPWWVWALGAWTVVSVLGLLRVDINSRVLAVLLSTEILVLLALSVCGLARPAGGHVSLATLAPSNLFTAGVGAVLAVAVLGYVGFEQAPVFAEEARHPRRTVPVATYLCLGVIAVVYAGASWAMAVAYGDHQVTIVAQQQGPGMLFALGPGVLPDLGQSLFLTSLFAAALAFHNAVWRYMFALGREHVLPPVLGRTGRNSVPKAASAVQSIIGLTVIVVFAMAGWDPMLKLFFWLGTTGGFGILLLLATTSISVIGFFARHRHDESTWRRLVAPGIATVALAVVVLLCLRNYATLLGVPPGSPAARLLPATYALAALIGLGWALILRLTRPHVYAAIGLGANTPTGEAEPPAVPGVGVARPHGTTR
jgi:amino acid transporter